MEVAKEILSACKENLEFKKSAWTELENGYLFSSWELPEGLRFVRDNNTKYLYLMISNEYTEYSIEDYELDSNISRDNALKFSKIINEGFLDKFADYISMMKKKSEQAIKDFNKS